MSQDPTEKPRNILPDLIIPVLALGFTGYYLTTITEVPWISQASAIVVSSMLTLSILAYIVRTVYRLKQGRETIHLGGTLHTLLGYQDTMIRRLGLLALTVGYVGFINYLGFTLTTFLFLFAAISLLSTLANWKRALIISVTSSVIGYVVFVYFFKTRFPMGPIENWLEGIL